MSVLELVWKDNPILHTPALEVEDLASQDVQQFIDDLLESARYYDASGLAANQVGALYRICVLTLPGDEPVVLVNPQIHRRVGQRKILEGCLSVGPPWKTVFRSKRVWVRALDRLGNPIRYRGATEYLGQVLEHEVGHLDGQTVEDILVPVPTPRPWKQVYTGRRRR